MDNIKTKSVSIQDLAPIIVKNISAGGYSEITVTGKSMLPLLLDRVSRVRLAEISTPKRGDMILYRRTNGTYVLHRLARCLDNGTFAMCGDAQTALECGIKREQMLAVVVYFARKKRWICCTNSLYCIWWHLHLAARPFRRLPIRVVNHIRYRAKKSGCK